jgi:alpha-galactosidase
MGAASPQWGYKITRDIIVLLSEDSGCARKKPLLVLQDIDAAGLETVYKVGLRVADLTGNRVRVEHTTDQKAAISGADFVVISLAVGSLEAMGPDLEIPAEYGVYQPVGDTVSIGGAIRAARNIPVMIGIGRDVETLAKPGAWILNLSNPMSSLTRSIAKYSKARVVGLCHELYNCLGMLSRCTGNPFCRSKLLEASTVSGINHCGWLHRLVVDGKDLLAQYRDEITGRGITPDSTRLYDGEAVDLRGDNVKMTLFLRHGVLPYSGDRHTSEFFTEYINAATNRGADYGVLLTTIQTRLVNWRGNARQRLRELLNAKTGVDLNVSAEGVARIIKSVAADDPCRDICNLPYRGDALPGVPEGAVIERMCTYDGSGAQPDEPPALPDPLHEHLALHAGIIEDVVDASATGNRALMLDALGRDPLLKNMDAARLPELWDRLAERNREFIHPDFLKPSAT